MRKLLPIVLLVLVSASGVAAKGWNGIMPMRSTREDVEARLGPPPPTPKDRVYTLHNGRSIYFYDEGEVYIVFADEELLAKNKCQSVAAGTVATIRITPNKERLVSNANLDKGFRKFSPYGFVDPGYEVFINDEEGIVVRASLNRVEEMVYFASASDRGRCPAMYESPEDFVPRRPTCDRPLDVYGNIRWSDAAARLDNFVIQLQYQTDAEGYVVVYAGQRATVGEAQRYAKRAWDYMVGFRGLDSKRVKAVDGGYREEFEVHLIVAPPGTVDGIYLKPRLDPSQVTLIPHKPRRTRK